MDHFMCRFVYGLRQEKRRSMISENISPQAYVNLAGYMLTHHTLTAADFAELEIEGDFLKNWMEEKSRYRKEFAAHGYDIVCLGENCMPLTILTRWGALSTQAEKQEDSKGRLPFELGISPLATVCDVLKNDFSGYAADTIQHNQANGAYTFSNSKNGLVFNHDPVNPEESVARNLSRFNDEIVPAKFALLKKILAKGKVIFLYNAYTAENVSRLPELRRIIGEKFGAPLITLINKRYRLESHDASLDYYYAWPAGYSWYQHKNYMQEESKRFEQGIVDFIISFIKTNDTLPPPADSKPATGKSRHNLYVRMALFYSACRRNDLGRRMLQKALEESNGNISDFWLAAKRRTG